MNSHAGSALLLAPKEKSQGRVQSSVGNASGRRVTTPADHPTGSPRFQKWLAGFGFGNLCAQKPWPVESGMGP